MHGTVSRTQKITQLDLVSEYLRGVFEKGYIEEAARSLQCSPAELTSRLGRAWFHPVRQRRSKKVSALPQKRSRSRSTVESVGVDRSTPGNVHKKVGYWDRLTPKQRQAEMQRRIAKRKKNVSQNKKSA